MKSIADLSNKKISAEFLLIGELVRGTPLEEWISKHPFYKVLAKASFEEHLQVVVRLVIRVDKDHRSSHANARYRERMAWELR